MSDELTFDQDALSSRHLIDFKAKTGLNLMGLLEDKDFDLTTADPEVIAAVIWLAMRMSGHPDATWDEAVDTPLSRLSFAKDDEPDPTNAS